MNRRAEQDISRKLKVLNHAKQIGNVSKTCRYFGICRETFYSWRRAYKKHGDKGLIDSRPCPENHKLRIAKPIEEKIIHLRTRYHFGTTVILWHLERNHGIKISRNGCYQVLLRNKLNRLHQILKNAQEQSSNVTKNRCQDIMFKSMLSFYFSRINWATESNGFNTRQSMIAHE